MAHWLDTAPVSARASTPTGPERRRSPAARYPIRTPPGVTAVAERARIDWDLPAPRVEVPHQYNAAADFIDWHRGAAHEAKTAFIDSSGEHSYASLLERVGRAGNALKGLDVRMESRVMMCLLDTVNFPAVFWGALKLGAVPVPPLEWTQAQWVCFLGNNQRPAGIGAEIFRPWL